MSRSSKWLDTTSPGGDGPDGHQGGVLFNAEMVAASTFSREMLEQRGKFFALAGGELVDELLPLGIVKGCVLHLNEGDAVVLLILTRGKFFAEESYWIGFRQIYSPGGNIHRTPYSGRNYEYYSEDANMSYICGEIQTKAMAEGGHGGHAVPGLEPALKAPQGNLAVGLLGQEGGHDGFIWGKLRDVAKYYLYTMSRSNLVNGLSKTERRPCR